MPNPAIFHLFVMDFQQKRRASCETPLFMVSNKTGDLKIIPSDGS